MGVARTGQLRRAEDRRAGQRHHAVAGQHRGHQRPGVERPVGERQLLRAERPTCRPRSAGRSRAMRTNVTLDLAMPRRCLPGSPQHGGHARLEDPALRPHPQPTWASTSTTCSMPTRAPRSTRTSAPCGERNGQQHDVAAADLDPERAVLALQRDGGLLKTHSELSEGRGRAPVAPALFSTRAVQSDSRKLVSASQSGGT